MKCLLMRYPGGKRKVLTLSYDDGVEQDKRLIKIMNDTGLRGTFNLNSGLFAEIHKKGDVHRRMTKDECFEVYSKSGQEVAVHALNHPFLTQIPIGLATSEIIEDRKNLERMFGTVVRGMAYPFGDYNDDVVNALRSSGIAYARTVVSTRNFDQPTDWLRMTATCHHNDPLLEELTDKFLKETPKYSSRRFYLWGHSYEFEDHNNWNVIENFAAKIGGKDDIWYATNIENYDYIDAFNHLRFDLDCSMVINPTATDICFELNDDLYEVKAGCTLHI